jgi:hypothetical protein
VLRDAMSTDGEDPAGIYFGTRNGRLYGSRDEGETWSVVADDLPPVTCVRAVGVRLRAASEKKRGRRRRAA